MNMYELGKSCIAHFGQDSLPWTQCKKSNVQHRNKSGHPTDN